MIPTHQCWSDTQLRPGVQRSGPGCRAAPGLALRSATASCPLGSCRSRPEPCKRCVSSPLQRQCPATMTLGRALCPGKHFVFTLFYRTEVNSSWCASLPTSKRCRPFRIQVAPRATSLRPKVALMPCRHDVSGYRLLGPRSEHTCSRRKGSSLRQADKTHKLRGAFQTFRTTRSGLARFRTIFPIFRLGWNLKCDSWPGLPLCSQTR